MLGRLYLAVLLFLCWGNIRIIASPAPTLTQQCSPGNDACSKSRSVPLPMRKSRGARRFATPNIERNVLDRFITNAQRMANGLAPLPPSWKTFKGSKGVFRRQNGPSPAIQALPQATPTPTFQSYTGHVGLRDPNGGSVGYMNHTATRSGLIGVNETIAGALRVQFRVRWGYTIASYSPIVMENWDSGYKDSFPLLGLINANATQDSGKDSHTHDPMGFFLGGIEVPQDPTITTPQYLNNSFTQATGQESEAEPNVWSIDIASGNITATWTDSSGHSIPVEMAVVNGVLVATNNLTYLSTVMGDNAQITSVTLHFDPLTE
ncbi:hypothetical protein CVT24_004270 [Panaeolus cyanescens]|uniref:GH16 domain-containing protein n=1 Tax=Panaeolus cyanescens TaxID=181874 RepID=A0A409VA88_9AGAR|nr:hypothetical protein CVT24_004270 [Panaeolus cyanescens]